MNKLRKFLVVGVMVLSVIAMSGLVVAPASAAASAGDLIKMDGLSSVYYLGSDGKRYVFPNEATYMSWHADFSGVVTIPASELQSYPLGGNVTMRPGTKLVKITTDPSVYAVEPNGVLRKIQSEAQAAALYGTNWSKRVVDVADSFFTNYTIGTALADGAVPAGSLVKNASSAAVYYYDGTNYRSIASEAALTANRFAMGNIITISNTITAGGSAISGAETGLTNDAQGGSTGVIVSTGSGLMVSLASGTPASMNVPKNTAVELMKMNLTAANDGDIIISGIKFTAAGLGTAGAIDEVTVYNGNTKLATSKDIDSNRVAQINFTNALTITRGATVTLTVKAKLSSTSGNYALQIEKAADINVPGVTVTGSFPIKGNEMSVVDVTVGQLTMDNDGSLSNVKLGDKQATLAKFKATADSVEDITINSITLKKDSTSTAADDDFENLKLYMDGAIVATSAGISNKYVTFTFTNPITILKSNNKRFVVKGDVADGASKTLKLILDSVTDVNAKGAHYGYSALISNGLTGSAVTINAGAFTIEKVNAVNDKIKKDTTDVEFGTFKMTANSGKNVEMSRFLLTIDSVNDSVAGAAFAKIENVELYNKTTNTVYDLAYASSASDSSKVYSNTAMGFVLNSGVTYELVVRADVKSTASNQEYTAKIASAYTSASVQDITIKETGNDTLITDITPNSVTLKKVTVQVPSVTLSTNALSAAYNAVVGTSDVEILNFNVKAGESSAVKMTELKIKDAVADNGTPDTITNAVTSEFKLWRGTTLLKTVSASQLSGEELPFSDLNETIAANTTVLYKVTTSLVKDSNLNGNTMKFRISGYSVEDTDKGAAVYDAVAENVSANGVVAAGETGETSLASARTVTLKGTGTLYVSLDLTDANVNADIYQVGGVATKELAALKLKAENEDVKVTKIKVTANDADFNKSVTALALYDGTTKIAETTTIAQTTIFDNLSLIVSQSSKNYYLRATLSNIGKDMVGALDQDYTVNINSVEAQGNSSGDTLVADTTGGILAGEIAYDNANGTFGEVGDTSTAESKKFGVVATRISAVGLEAAQGGSSLASSLLDNGYMNTAIIKVTTDASNNSLSTGDAVKTVLSKIKVKVDYNLPGYLQDTMDASIERIGGVNSAIALADVTSAATAGTAYARFTVSGSDYELAPGQTAYYLVKFKADYTVSGNHDAWIKVGLDKLNGADAADATGGNFLWKDSSEATAKADLRLTNLTNIDGAQIKD